MTLTLFRPASSLSVRLRFKAITGSFPLLPWGATRPRPAGLRPRILLCSFVPPCYTLLACYSVLFIHAVVTTDAALVSGVEDRRLSRPTAGRQKWRRPSVRREVLACSTDWRHRRQRLSGRSVSTLIEQNRMTGRQRAEGPDEAALQDAWPKPSRARARCSPGGGGKPMREGSRTLRQRHGAAESESCGPGQGRPEWRRSRLMAGSRAAERGCDSNCEAASRSLIKGMREEGARRRHPAGNLRWAAGPRPGPRPPHGPRPGPRPAPGPAPARPRPA